MRLVGCVQHATADVGAEQALAGAQDRVERRHRSAGRKQAAGGFGKTHPVAEPVEGVGLELDEHRRSLPDAREAIGRVGDEVGERGGIEAAAGNVGQISRPDRRKRPRDAVAEQVIEQRTERGALLGRRFSKRTAKRRRVDVAAARLIAPPTRCARSSARSTSSAIARISAAESSSVRVEPASRSRGPLLRRRLPAGSTR